MDAIRFQNIVDESEFNSWQILMSELDTTLDRMRCIVFSRLRDAHEISQFEEFWDYVVNNEPMVVSVTDDASLYEIGEDAILVVLYSNLDEKMVIFDKQDRQKIMGKIISVKENGRN